MSVCKHAVLLLLVVYSVRSAKILGVFNFASVSHQIVYQPIWRELSLRGHDVTVLTPNPLKDPTLTNLTEVDLSSLYNIFGSMSAEFSMTLDHWEVLKMWPDNLYRMTEEMYSHPEVLSLINDTSKEFDVLIAEYISPPVLAFAARFKCPFIGVSSLGIQNPVLSALGHPVHPILYPELLTTFGDELSFVERVDSVLFAIYYEYFSYYKMFPTCDKIARKYFGDGIPYLREIQQNISMLFVNTNPIIHKARPYGPDVVEMGRMHLKPKKPLPKVSVLHCFNELP